MHLLDFYKMFEKNPKKMFEKNPKKTHACYFEQIFQNKATKQQCMVTYLLSYKQSK